MPIIKSAAKELRKSKKRHLRNMDVLSELKTLQKGVLQLIDEKKVPEAQKLFNVFSSRLDKAARKNVIHKNQASRKKSRLMIRLKKAQ